LTAPLPVRLIHIKLLSTVLRGILAVGRGMIKSAGFHLIAQIQAPAEPLIIKLKQVGARRKVALDKRYTCIYNVYTICMKYFNWNSEKNKKLIKERGVSFEICLVKIESKDVLDILNNINYPNQKIFVLEIEGYVYLVPFIENEDEIFLKTIIPSRKFTKKYLK